MGQPFKYDFGVSMFDVLDTEVERVVQRWDGSTWRMLFRGDYADCRTYITKYRNQNPQLEVTDVRVMRLKE